MPLKLNVGLSKKIGQPNYGSLGASCHLEIELDAQLMTRDRDEFDQQVQQAFVACSLAVQGELDRHVSSPQPPAASPQVPAEVPHGNGQATDHNHGSTNGASRGGTNGQSAPDQNRRKRRRATSSQVRAIFAIANRQNVNLDQALRDRFGVEHPSELNVSDASHFIDELQLLAAGTGGSL
jgi:hypothetical protein